MQGMVAPKPSLVPRKMQIAGETPKDGEAATAAPGAAAAPRKPAEAVYTPASDALLEVRYTWDGGRRDALGLFLAYSIRMRSLDLCNS